MHRKDETKRICGMKNYLAIALALACVVLVILLVMLKRGDDAQHENDAGSIADFSNRLDSAQGQISVCNGTMRTLSNSLDQSQSVSLAFSNQLAEAQSTLILDAEQITNLNLHIAVVESENQTLNRSIADLNSQTTNQALAFMKQIALNADTLDQAHKDYALLENRLRIDVAERVVVERKFHNVSELQDQIQNLKENPYTAVSAESIYAGLDVEVKSNSFHVISPN
jgi:hypothetical protein